MEKRRMLQIRSGENGILMRQLARLFLEGSSLDSSEGDLLERFVRSHDESAFEALVARHGPMVLGVCRQLLRDPNDVDDAFQATFLVLIRKAATLRRCDLVGNWLYGVAFRVAKRARTQAARRMGRSGSVTTIEKLSAAEGVHRSGSSPTTLIEPESGPWLHQEISHLPDKYRTPIVLCYLEGLTHDEAASRIGCPLGTVKGRLSRARDLLRRRLTRRGFALSSAALASQLRAPLAKAAVPAALELTTTRAALSLVSIGGSSLASASFASIPVTALADGVLKTMIWNQVRFTASSLLLAGALASGVAVGATQFISGADRVDDTRLALQSAKHAAVQSRAAVEKTPGAASDKTDKSISPDLLSQINSTNRTFDAMLARERNFSLANIDRMSNWSSLTLSADLVLAINRDDALAARRAHRDRMKKLHEVIQNLPASAKNQTVNAQHAEGILREAEMLLQSTGDWQSGSAMMGMMQAQMRGMMGAMGTPKAPETMGGMMSGGMKGSFVGGRSKDRGGSALRGGSGLGSGDHRGGLGGGAAVQGSASQTGVSSGGMAAGMGGGTASKGGFGGGMMAPMMGEPRDHATSGLGLALASSATELAIRDKNPNSKLIHKKLDEPISISFARETPLEDVLKHVKQATTTRKYAGIPIYLDPQGLEEVEKNPNSTLKYIDFEGIPLKTSLRLILKQLGLAFCVRDGLLIVSSPGRIFDELREARQELETAKEIKELEGESKDERATDEKDNPEAPAQNTSPQE
jgi:RNA polymerase sigma factor (sigma-70 family)